MESEKYLRLELDHIKLDAIDNAKRHRDVSHFLLGSSSGEVMLRTHNSRGSR